MMIAAAAAADDDDDNNNKFQFPGDTTSETVTLMEDNMMVLGSLLSNRLEQKSLLLTFYRLHF